MRSAQPRPRFGAFLPSWVGPGEFAPTAAFLQDFARRAEDVGFDSVWVFDHLFEAVSSYRVVFMEPLTMLALVAGATRRVALGTGILVLPLRDPIVTAKACQEPKETRGRRTDEMLEIIDGLWTHDSYAYDGRYFKLPEVRLLPRPIQRPRPPILVAGSLVPPGTSRHITRSRGYTAHRPSSERPRWATGS
jgi:alkanesulfonate monooxygenase SsuD/methylene tetrahydromethanopterin reductase-like flavin-dependent oxidoreductase (luciferase family)